MRPTVSHTPCRICGGEHTAAQGCERLLQAEVTLGLLGVPAFLTDPLNRIVRVNAEFARLIGDPFRDRVQKDLLFIHALVAGPYRDRFEQPVRLVARCLPALINEIDAGRLSGYARVLIDRAVAADPDLQRALRAPSYGWDGTVAVRDGKRGWLSIREQVTPVSGPEGNPTGYHISLWFPSRRAAIAATDGADPATVRDRLTPRQAEIACRFARGMNHRQVAEAEGISPATARSFLEDIYSRLNVHSRAELTSLVVRAGLV
jgi:DNA-binding CsgD family transcriptional regulator/PAS domain-containing protein